MFYWNVATESGVGTISDVSYDDDKCNDYDIRSNTFENNLVGQEPQHFNQKSLDKVEKVVGKVFIDVTEYLRKQGFFVVWEQAQNREYDPWGTKIIWVPVANELGKVFLSKTQVDKLHALVDEYKQSDVYMQSAAENTVGSWFWTVKENLKRFQEVSEGHRMCLFLYRSGPSSLVEPFPWELDDPECMAKINELNSPAVNTQHDSPQPIFEKKGPNPTVSEESDSSERDHDTVLQMFKVMGLEAIFSDKSLTEGQKEDRLAEWANAWKK